MELRMCYAILILLAASVGLKLSETEALEDEKEHFSSTFDLPCTQFDRNYAYCWCKTLAGWDYCSFTESRTHEDKKCKSGHMCGKHGKAYSWCYTNNDQWSYCGRVAPKAPHKDTGPVVSHMTPTYMPCLNECGRGMGKAYFWCYTAKGWDYCSPMPHVSPSNMPCRGDFPCGLYGQAYYWCYTTGSDWDYCGPIKDAECGYKDKDSWKSTDQSSELQLTCRESTDAIMIQTQFVAETAAAWTDGYSHYHEVTVELLPSWNRSLVTNQTLPVMLRSEHLTLILQGKRIIEKEPYDCYQIQIGNSPGIPIAQVLIPENKKVPERYIRKAFKESLLRKAAIRISVLEY